MKLGPLIWMISTISLTESRNRRVFKFFKFFREFFMEFFEGLGLDLNRDRDIPFKSELSRKDLSIG